MKGPYEFKGKINFERHCTFVMYNTLKIMKHLIRKPVPGLFDFPALTSLFLNLGNYSVLFELNQTTRTQFHRRVHIDLQIIWFEICVHYSVVSCQKHGIE